MPSSHVFPDYAVKQAFTELKIDRSDDGVIFAIQNDLVSRCLVIIMKSAIVSCVLHKRKYINAQDIKYALSTTTFPCSKRSSTELGYLMDTRQFGHLFAAHMEFVWATMTRHGIEPGQPIVRVSEEMLVHVQQAVEQLIRGFMEYFASRGKVYGYRHFDTCLSELIGESVADEQRYAPLASSG